MPYERHRVPRRVLEAADLRPISRPNVNFAHTDLPIPTHAVRDYDEPKHLRDLRLPTHILDSVNPVGIDAPLAASSTSINWWPYPPWGQSTSSLTPSETASSSLLPSLVAAVSTGSLISTTSSLAVTPSLSSSVALSVSVISITALPPTISLPSRPNIHATAHPGFNLLYLLPVFILIGLLVGALSGLLGYRWYMRRHTRMGGNGNGFGKVTLIPGPPYVSMMDAGDTQAGMQETSPTAVGSPSKYTRHGVPPTTKPWLTAVSEASSRRSSTRNTAPPSSGTAVGAASSRLSTSPKRPRSRGSAISPDSLSSDDENSRHSPTRNVSFRRNILNRLQRGPDRKSRGVSRDLSRRTAQTYLSSGSAYSGTHSGQSRAPSAVPSSTPPSRDANTEWARGSGFRIVEETICSPSTGDHSSLSDAPRPTSAWDSGEALRQAVDTHPGERWLAWTRNWASSPPRPRDSEDRFTAVPSRRTAQEKKDVDMLLRSPPQVTSSPLESTLTFSPKPEYLARPVTNGNPKRHLQGTTRIRPVLQAAAARGTSNASSITLGDGHGTPAMRYAARHTALSRVEEILANSYSSRDLTPDSPNAFGASPASLEDIAWAVGIEQRLAVAASVDREEV
jgi:hypothetical protein